MAALDVAEPRYSGEMLDAGEPVATARTQQVRRNRLGPCLIVGLSTGDRWALSSPNLLQRAADVSCMCGAALRLDKCCEICSN